MSKAMRDLGDKIASTLVAQSANVNCVPWSGSHITINYSEQGIVECIQLFNQIGIPDNIYTEACVHTLEEAQAALKKIGLPVMVKASEGGGGKGIRKVVKEDELASAFRQVCFR
jgi:biotin carboxylase